MRIHHLLHKFIPNHAHTDALLPLSIPMRSGRAGWAGLRPTERPADRPGASFRRCDWPAGCLPRAVTGRRRPPGQQRGGVAVWTDRADGVRGGVDSVARSNIHGHHLSLSTFSSILLEEGDDRRTSRLPSDGLLHRTGPYKKPAQGKPGRPVGKNARHNFLNSSDLFFHFLYPCLFILRTYLVHKSIIFM